MWTRSVLASAMLLVLAACGVQTIDGTRELVNGTAYDSFTHGTRDLVVVTTPSGQVGEVVEADNRDNKIRDGSGTRISATGSWEDLLKRNLGALGCSTEMAEYNQVHVAPSRFLEDMAKHKLRVQSLRSKNGKCSAYLLWHGKTLDYQEYRRLDRNFTQRAFI